MLTAFGKFCRKLRIERDEILKNMADKLGVTPSYLSAVEIGKRAIPATWRELIINIYNLTPVQQQELRDAIDNSTTQIKLDISAMNASKRQTALAFARKLDEMDDEEIRKILELIKMHKKGGN